MSCCCSNVEWIQARSKIKTTRNKLDVTQLFSLQRVNVSVLSKLNGEEYVSIGGVDVCAGVGRFTMDSGTLWKGRGRSQERARLVMAGWQAHGPYCQRTIATAISPADCGSSTADSEATPPNTPNIATTCQHMTDQDAIKAIDTRGNPHNFSR